MEINPQCKLTSAQVLSSNSFKQVLQTYLWLPYSNKASISQNQSSPSNFFGSILKNTQEQQDFSMLSFQPASYNFTKFQINQICNLYPSIPTQLPKNLKIEFSNQKETQNIINFSNGFNIQALSNQNIQLLADAQQSINQFKPFNQKGNPAEINIFKQQLQGKGKIKLRKIMEKVEKSNTQDQNLLIQCQCFQKQQQQEEIQKELRKEHLKFVRFENFESDSEQQLSNKEMNFSEDLLIPDLCFVKDDDTIIKQKGKGKLQIEFLLQKIQERSQRMKSYICDKCNRTFRSYAALGGHKAKNHPKKNNGIAKRKNQFDLKPYLSFIGQP